MSEATELDVNTVPLDQIDVSNASIFETDTWQPWFARLRKEAPVHYCAESSVGAYWSVTTHDLIKQVDSFAISRMIALWPCKNPHRR